MSTANKLTYLSQTKDKLKTTINYAGAGIDNTTTFRQYDEKLYNKYIDIINNGTDTLYSNLPKVSASNVSEATLNNTVECKMVSELKPNTSQDSTTGKNLFNITNYELISTSANGSPSNITKTSNSMSFTSNSGNSYSGIYIKLSNFTSFIDNFDADTNYYVSVDITTNVNCEMYFMKTGASNLNQLSIGTQRIIYTGKITNNIVFYHLLIYKYFVY